MKKIETVLCVIDFENGADEASRQAHRYAANHNAKLAFLAVTPSIDRNAVLFPHLHEKLAMDQSKLESKILNGLSERITKLTERTADQFQIIADSGAEDAIVIRIAEELAADLVVIPQTAVTSLESWFGSVANRMIRYMHCSVLLTRPEQGGGCIVAATDFSDPSFPAVEAAALEARLRHCKLVLVHSLGELRVAARIPPEPVSMGMITTEEFGTLTTESREQLVQVLKKMGAVGEPVVADDLPADAIVRLAKERHADLIVVGTVGRSGIPRLVLGSTAESVVGRAPCSVLVVRLH
jgi:nucleotide-binding universal stress UspA family protein